MELNLTDEELLEGLELDLAPKTNLPATTTPEQTLKNNAPSLYLDPALMGYPAMLPMELAMGTDTPDNIFAGYGLTQDEALKLLADPNFTKALASATEQLKEEGMSFKVKAKLQAEELLKKSWLLIHDPTTPHSVRADLIKSTVRWAGLEPKPNQTAGDGMTALQININLGDK